jgi:exonuclease III
MNPSEINKDKSHDSNFNHKYLGFVSNRRRLSLSAVAWKWIGGGVVIVLVFAGYIAYSVLQNVETDAAACTTKTLSSGANSSCVKYAQQLLNGVSSYFSVVPKTQGTLSATAISTNGKFSSATSEKVKVFQSYSGKSSTGTIDKSTWYDLCDYTRKAYTSFSINLRTDAIKDARTAYSKAGCASATSDISLGASDVVSTDNESAILDDESVQPDNSSDLTPLPESERSTATPTIATLPSTESIVVATWNIEGGNPAGFSSQLRQQGLTSLQNSADVISLQESHIASFRKTLQTQFLCQTCSMSGMDFGAIPVGSKPYTNSGSMPSSLPILWKRDRFTLEGYGAYTVLSKSYLDESKEKVSPKWITWVRLKDTKSSQSLYIINTHTVSQVEAKGMPQRKEVKRNATFTNHMDLLQKILVNNFQSDALPVLISGDFNVNYRYDSVVKYKNFPFARMTESGIVSNWSYAESAGLLPLGGTRNVDDTRLIDYIWLKQQDKIAFESTTIHNNSYGSDHFPVFATIAIK